MENVKPETIDWSFVAEENRRRELTTYNDATPIKKPSKISYAIVSTKVGTKKFTGYTCTRIRKELIIQGNFWVGSFSKDRFQYEEHVSPGDCWYMKQSKTCNGKKMTQLERVSIILVI